MTATEDDFDREYEALLKQAVEKAPTYWSITGYKGHRTRNGVAWVGRLRLHEKAVAYLEDAGNGGGVRIDFWDGKRRNIEAEGLLTADVKTVLPNEPGWSGTEMFIEALLQRAGK